MNKRNVNRIGQSMAGLFIAYAVIQFFQWLLVSAGAYLTGFQGNIQWAPFAIYATAGHWSPKQVFSLYLIPYLVFLLLWLLLRAKQKVVTGKPLFYHLMKAWLFMLLLIKVLFFPFWQIISKSGVYYPLAWMGMTKTQQTGIAAVLLVLFIIYSTGISQFFGSALDKKGKTFLRPAEIKQQLIFLWFVPFVLFSLILFCFAASRSPAYYLSGGVALVMLINLPVICRYKVIVR